MKEKELGEKAQSKKQKKKAAKNAVQDASEEIIYKIEVPANRYDLLCLEGICRALRIFLDQEKPPVYKELPTESRQVMIAKPETKQIRPIVVGAILRDLSFDPVRYDSFMDLQQKLHHNVCRRRTLVSIGTHDLDTIKGPFTYEARKPEDIVFAPLNSKTEMNAKDLFDHLRETDKHLRPFLSIIEDSPVYPVIYDSTGKVLSLPPIINSDHSKISLDTKNVLIEITGTDLTKCKIVLDVMVTMFSEYCKDKFSVERLLVRAEGEEDSAGVLYPSLENRKVTTTAGYLNKLVGTKLDIDKIVELLSRMQLPSEVGEGDNVIVTVPPTRSDILHPCDVAEDVAIAFGYNNLALTVPRASTVGKQQPINKVTDLLRVEIALAGFTEILTHSLVSRDENYTMLRLEEDNNAVVLANPQTVEFQLGRTRLLPGALKTVAHNRSLPLPVRVFEISDVMLRDDASEVGAKNERHLVAVNYNKSAEFELLHGLLDRVMLLLGQEKNYYIKETDNPTYFAGRCAEVYLGKEQIGVFGILHPEVIKNFELALPAAALELNIEPFLAIRAQAKSS
eukprot:TRINITY_DN579_c0_g1_i1.p1 TRINITY_DN579_c0_g1~~TRINITY_DN579_c0_g1_i1.p1  ORF type:complete len:642 (-),score=122.35 TRINITY_DN579_c0_g1_i1:35-1729(-)